jgi:hypothetical protein
MNWNWRSVDHDPPPVETEVWTSDGTNVQRGQFCISNPDEPEDGFWTDLSGDLIDVEYWMLIEDGPKDGSKPTIDAYMLTGGDGFYFGDEWESAMPVPPKIPFDLSFDDVINCAGAGATMAPRDILPIPEVDLAQEFVESIVTPILSQALYDLETCGRVTGVGVVGYAVAAGGPAVELTIRFEKLKVSARPAQESGSEDWLRVEITGEPAVQLQPPWDPNEIVAIVDGFIHRAMVLKS